MKRENKKIHLLLLFVVLSGGLYANGTLATLPSEETKNQITQMNAPVNHYSNRNGGPPGGGTGGGGAVGTPLPDGTIPILVAGLLYISVIAKRKYGKNQSH